MKNQSWAPLVLLGLLAALSQLLAWLTRPPESVREFIGPPRSDYTLNEFELNALDAKGALAFTITAPLLSRRGDDGSIHVDTPNYQLVDGKGNIWKGKSESAWVNKDGSLMKLQGAVEMHRDPTPTLKAAQFNTSDLTAWPKERRMESAAPTTFAEPGSLLRGIGMQADLNTHQLDLLANVHAILTPKKKTAH